MKRLLAIAGGALLVLGLAVGGCGAWLAGGTVRSLLFDTATEGKVVGHDRRWLSGASGRGRALIRPVVSFTDRQGRRHTFTDPVSTTPELVSGSRVRVWYDPDHPDGARVASNRLWMSVLGLVQLFGGGLCLLLGALLLLFARFARRSN